MKLTDKQELDYYKSEQFGKECKNIINMDKLIMEIKDNIEWMETTEDEYEVITKENLFSILKKYKIEEI